MVISEVKISPTENRFIKLYNQGDSAVDLTNWYIQRKTQTGSSFESLVSKTYFENKNINAGGYFLISRSQMTDSDIILSTLTLTESNAIQIKNSSGKVVDMVCWGDMSDCGTQIPNPASDQSILTGHDASTFIPVSSNDAGSPASSSDNSNTSAASPGASSNSNSSVATATVTATATNNITAEVQEIKTQVTAKTFGFAGVPVSFQSTTSGSVGEQMYSGKYFLNFGDGDSKEMQFPGIKSFTHTYFYPGSYLFSLSYYQYGYSDTPDATSQINIKIVPADVSISRVGDEKDFFVELWNDTDYDADISGWILASEQKSFTFPRDTILQSKNKMIISSRITNFSVADQSTLKLMTPEGNTIFDYSTPAVSANADVRRPTSVSISYKANLAEGYTKNEIPPQNLLASAVSSDPEKNSGTSSSNTTVIFSVFLAFIGVSSYAVYLIHRRKVVPEAGEDFEILDE